MIIDVVSMTMVVARVAYPTCFSSIKVVAYILQVSRLYLTQSIVTEKIHHFCHEMLLFLCHLSIER